MRLLYNSWSRATIIPREVRRRLLLTTRTAPTYYLWTKNDYFSGATSRFGSKSLLLLPHSSRGSSKKFARRSLSKTTKTKNDETNIVKNDIAEHDDTRPITSMVKKQIQQGKLLEDEDQLALAARLDDLRAHLCATDAHVIDASRLSVQWFSDSVSKGLLGNLKQWGKRAYFHFHFLPTTMPLSLSSLQSPRGIYIHGAVGVGKSRLMDLFFDQLLQNNCLPRRNIKRVHFHEFMLDVHERIHQFKRRHPKEDPLPAVALSLAQEARLLCLDEFQVTDIADAMILKRLFSMLWMDTLFSSSTTSNNNNNNRGSGSGSGGIGMVVVATSNRDPEALYEGGLNRSLFLPFITTLKRHMDIVEMGGDKDYRREKSNSDINNEMASGSVADQLSYYWPANETRTRQALDRIFSNHGNGMLLVERNTRVPVRMGRHVTVPRANNQTCAWFDFQDLCHQPLGAADYLAICERFPILIVDHVPQLNASRFNEARRFVTLIDAVYESRTRLVLACEVPLKDLLVHFEATVESHDGDEEIAVESVHSGSDNQQEEATLFVKGQGGSSSSSSTTMIRTKDGDVEWSATGRVGVSLAQLSAVRDVSFSFQRAESRLVEMNNGTWGRRA